MIGAEQLNVDDLLGRNMKISREGNEPKILIFHTHSQETFVDSVPGDISTGIVGIGQYLTELLNAKGIPTLHDLVSMILLTENWTGVRHMKMQKLRSVRSWRRILPLK